MSEDFIPPGSMIEAAVSMFEIFTSLCQAGFTQSQAILIIAEILRPR